MAKIKASETYIESTMREMLKEAEYTTVLILFIIKSM